MAIAAIESSGITAVPQRADSASQAAPGFDMALAAAKAGATHRVQAGETLSGIVLEHLRGQNQSPTQRELYDAVQRIASLNGLSDADIIFPGQELTLRAEAAQLPPTQDKAREELVRALVPPVQPNAYRAPDMGGPKLPLHTFSSARLETLRQVATEITDAISHPIRYAKGSESLMRILPSPILRNENSALAALRTTKAVEDPAVQPAASSPWAKILSEPARLTSEFGPRRDPFDGTSTRHDGIDLAAKRGADIYPMDDGVVKFSGWMPGYGNIVVVKHAGGTETVYGHNAKNLVKTGDSVAKGEAIATVGSSGRSTGPHLHFEIRHRGKAVNPIPHLTETHDHP